MKDSILYISYTGLLDPLGQSQVFQYVKGLARDYRMILLTFEKPEAMVEVERLREIEDQCKRSGVVWHRLTYHRTPSIPATVYDLVVGIRTALRLARSENVQIVHCRSYLAGLMGLVVKRRTGARYIFDMRGFWPDERVDGGIWKRNSLIYRLFKYVEKRLFLGADYIISLTRAGIREFEKFDYLKGRVPPVSVIPTCTNLEFFHPVETERVGFTIGYVGSAGSWYMFNKVSKAVAQIFEKRPDAKFLVINKGGHDVVRAHLNAAGVDISRVEVKEVLFEEVSTEIGRMDAGVFFIMPAWSKRASCPTRMGEFLACGKPCLANGGVGDVEEDLKDTHTGIVINEFDNNTINAAVDQLFELVHEDGIAERCREAAKDRFSLQKGIAEYSRVYKKLI